MVFRQLMVSLQLMVPLQLIVPNQLMVSHQFRLLTQALRQQLHLPEWLHHRLRHLLVAPLEILALLIRALHEWPATYP